MSLNRSEIYDLLVTQYKSYVSNLSCSYKLEQSLMILSMNVFGLAEAMKRLLPDLTVENIIIPHTNEPVCIVFIVFIVYKNIQKFRIHCGMETLEVFVNKRLLDAPKELVVAYREFRVKAQMPEEVVFQLETLFSSFEETKEPLPLPSCTVEIVPHWDFQEPDWAIQDDREWENSYVYPFYTH